MTSDPDQIKQDIERTRGNLSTDVDALAYKASPGRMVRERQQRIRSTFQGVRDRVMGTASRAGDAVADKAAAVGDAASQAPQAIRRQAQGNPLAAGLIVFGLGWLVSSLIPPSQAEEEAARRVKDHADTIKQEVGQVASEMKDHLRDPATEAVETVKTTATNAADTVKQESRSAVDQVQDQAQYAREELRG